MGKKDKRGAVQSFGNAMKENMSNETRVHKRRLIVKAVALAALAECVEEPVLPCTAALLSEHEDELPAMMVKWEYRRGRTGRLWSLTRNDIKWFERYAITPIFSKSKEWKALFRVSFPVFQMLESQLRSELFEQTTPFRKPIPANVRIAAFLMYAGGATCAKTAAQLGIGTSTVQEIVAEVGVNAVLVIVVKLTHTAAVSMCISCRFQRQSQRNALSW